MKSMKNSAVVKIAIYMFLDYYARHLAIPKITGLEFFLASSYIIRKKIEQSPQTEIASCKWVATKGYILLTQNFFLFLKNFCQRQES
jgi:hypothetical protein